MQPSGTTIFGLTPEKLATISQAGRRRFVERGEALTRRGDEAEWIGFVLRGRFEVRVEGRVVAEIAAQQPIGEIAFLTGERRTADLVAARDSEVLTIDRSAWDQLVRSDTDVMSAVTAALARRLAAATARVPGQRRMEAKVLCVMAGGSTPLPEGFADRLVSALNERGETLRVVQSDQFRAGSGDEAQTGAALLAGEGSAERSLYVALGDNAVSRSMIRQADAVMMVVQAGGDPAPNALERYAFSYHAPEERRLVIARTGGQITGTQAWTAPRDVQYAHHLQLDDGARRDADLRRLARFVTGKARGIVLGGGGALGCAHIGVVRALQDAGIEIDYWGGTSIGGAIAIAFALGLAPEEVMRRCDDMFVRNLALGRFAPPVHGLLDARHFDRQLQENFNWVDLLDMPTPVFAAATSLTTNDLCVIRSGQGWEAVRASGSLPVFLPPFIRPDGELLIDGALMDNLPVSAMRQIKSGPNLIVSLAADREYRTKARYEDLPTRLQTLLALARRRRRGGIPGLANTMSRAMLVASRREMAKTELGADILLQPPSLPGMGLMSWKRGREQEEKAYEYTKAAIEEGRLVDFAA